MNPDEDETRIVGGAEAEDDDTVRVSGDEDDTTIVEEAGDDGTVIVGEAGDDSTVIVARDDEDPTVIVGDTAPPPPRAGIVKPAMDRPPRRRRGELRPAPVPSGYGGIPIAATGAGAVSTYRARPLPAPPAPSDPSVSRPVRVVGGVPSIERRSRRIAVGALTAFGASFVVAAAGIAWAVRTIVGG